MMLEHVLITELQGVGPKMAEHLERLNIFNVRDLLFHLPLRYEDRTRITPIRRARVGDSVVVQGKIRSCTVEGKRRLSLLCFIEDETGVMALRLFHYGRSQKVQLSNTDLTLRCFGEVRFGSHGVLEMVHPEYRQINIEQSPPLAESLTPVYPTTKGLSQLLLRKLMAQAFAALKADTLPELLPPSVQQSLQLPNLYDAIHYVHQPPKQANIAELATGTHAMQQRLAFEELLAHQLSLQKLRFSIRSHNAPLLENKNQLTRKLLDALPFTLTGAQKRVVSEISTDLSGRQPMLRLVQGDVGSGKTIVAALAILQAIENNQQAALMAPTEILAEQHLHNFIQWLAPLGVKVGCLLGRQSAGVRKALLTQIAHGELDIVIGTHALIQQDVEFANLALLVVDEQHRFGVHQRLALKEKGTTQGQVPHQLIMTATPIPRTLTMMAYADLDCSIIDELPPGRKPVTTVLIPNQRRGDVVERLRLSCESKRQAYWICTLVEDSDVLQAQAAEQTALQLREQLPAIKIGLVHGRLKNNEKETIMQAFKQGEIDLLVATTVVEVGVDVPNASVMVIENPERLGLAQLHQLRGRVGRGEQASHCVLLYQGPLSETAQKRLNIMRQTQDGFVIAQEDLNMRGPGEVLGTRQAGLMRFRIADLLRDKTLLPQVKEAGELIVEAFPQNGDAIVQRWLAGSERYARV